MLIIVGISVLSLGQRGGLQRSSGNKASVTHHDDMLYAPKVTVHVTRIAENWLLCVILNRIVCVILTLLTPWPTLSLFDPCTYSKYTYFSTLFQKNFQCYIYFVFLKDSDWSDHTYKTAHQRVLIFIMSPSVYQKELLISFLLLFSKWIYEKKTEKKNSQLT